MRRIGILGGTFDPPHCGHLLIANEVLHALKLDEVWFMPNREPPHKEKTGLISNEDRLALIRLAISGHPSFRIETIELQRSGPSYTYDTMTLLVKKHPDVEFFFIIGADMIEYLPKWHKISELIAHSIYRGRTPDYQTDSPYPLIFDVPGLPFHQA